MKPESGVATLESLTRASAPLVRIDAGSSPDDAAPRRRFAELVLVFENDVCLRIGTDSDTDELRWLVAPNPELVYADLATYCPEVRACYGAAVLWSRVMVNTQGYTDALQLETKRADRPTPMTLQFLVQASHFQVSLVTPLG